MFRKVFVAWKKGYGEKIALKAFSILRDLGIEYVFDEPRDCDLAIMAGGDGTLLGHQASLECPILGINPGKSVGYYMAADNRNFEKMLRRLLTGKEGKDYFFREYPRLETSINKIRLPFPVLNEVLVSPIYVRRTMYSKLILKRKKTLECNSGIIIYTPSGSHGYAKSAGAKVMGDGKKFGVAALAPCDGRLKKGEITEGKRVSVKYLGEEGEICVDGQEHQICRIRKDDMVTVRKSKKPAKIVHFRK